MSAGLGDIIRLLGDFNRSQLSLDLGRKGVYSSYTFGPVLEGNSFGVSVSASGASSVAVSDTVAWSSSGAKYVVASGVSVELSEADSLPPQVRGRQRSGRKKSRVLSLFCVFFGKGKNKEGNYLHKMIFPTGDWNFFTHKDNCTNN